MQKGILVDLLPVLPGGLNGGAKIMVIDLLKNMFKLRPHIQWTLLIQHGMEKELSELSMSNVHFMILNESPFTFIYNFTFFFIRKLRKKTPLPNYIHLKFLKIINYIRPYAIKKIKNLDYGLLFCPFTDPVFHKKNIPTVSIVYDLQYMTYPFFFDLDDLTHRQQVIKNACSRATHLITISEYTRSKLLEKQKLPAHKITTIPICLGDRLKINFYSMHILNKYQLKAKNYLIYPANYWKHKNHEMLIKAFEMVLRETNTPFQLVFTGAICERQKFLKDVVKKMNLDESILFLDYVSNKELASLIKNSISLVFPSLYEGFGMPIIEAMTLGVPVICSNTTSLPEVAGNAAFLFIPQDLGSIKNAIIQIITESDRRKHMIKKGYSRAQKYSDVQMMAKNYLEIFEYCTHRSSLAVKE